MKIRSVNAFLLRLPLTKPYTIAYSTFTDTRIVFLEIGLENGITGMGSANPFEAVVGETPENALSNLQSDFMQEWVGRDIRHFNQLINEACLQFPHLPGTLAAIDIALHDAFTQFLGISVMDFYGQQISPIPTSITLGIKETAEMMEEARQAYAAGFRILKIKTGVDVEQDIERVRKIADYFKKDIRIRVDANQGYTIDKLRHFIGQTSTLGIELIEQPLPTGQENQLTQLDIADRALLVADESLLDANSALQWAADPRPFGVFNIKLMKCGGIRGAREIAAIAQLSGINLFWGCNDESIVSITAALHVALSCSNTRYLDLDGSFDIVETLVEGGFTLKDGFLLPNGLPGLGIRKVNQTASV